MRSRPTLELTYWPRDPRPGDTVQFEAALISRSETPVDAVRFRFRGIEERASRIVNTGKSSMVVRDYHTHTEQEAHGARHAAGSR